MDGTGAGTSTGRSAGPADVTDRAADGTTGPSRPAGPADATGPLPVQAPADATGPLPLPQAGSQFPGDAAETAAQPVVDAGTAPTAPPSWFATGPLPVIPPAPDTAALPEVATPPAGAAAAPPPAADATPPAGLFDAGPTAPNAVAPPPVPQPPAPQPAVPTGQVPQPPVPTGQAPLHPASQPPVPTGQVSPPVPPGPVSQPPVSQPPVSQPPAPPGPASASLFEPAGDQPSTNGAATGPPPVTPASAGVPAVGPPPPGAGIADVPPAAGLPIFADPTPPTSVFPAVGPPPDPGAPPAAGSPVFEDPTPPTSVFPAIGPPPDSGASTPPDAIPAAAAPAPPTGLFTAVTPPTHTAPPAAGPPVPVDPAPPTGVFAAVGPPPAAPSVPAAFPVVGPTPGFVPAGPARPADATGPMPVIDAAGAPPAAAPPEAAPPTTAGEGPWSPLPPTAEVRPGTEAWTFGADESGPARTDAWAFSSDDRRGTQSRPLPVQAGGGHSAGVITPSGARPARRPQRKAWPLTLAGVLVAVAAGIALVFSVARTNPADLVTTAATEAGSWRGAHYQGAVAATDGGEIRFDLTVTTEGAFGTLSRDGGRATADLYWDQSGALIRANREWWLYHHPTRAGDLAGVWVADPLTETQEIDPVLRLHPAALAAQVRGEQPTQWQAVERQLVEGRPGIVLSENARRVVVGSDDPHPLLAVDVAPDASTSPVPVGRSTDEEVTAVTGAAARIRQEAAPKSLAQMLQERPNVGIQLQPDPRCIAQTCNVTATVNNSGTAPARGHLEIKADGQVVANHPLDVQPGQVATFSASAPNPHFGQSGATGQILWEFRAVNG